MIRLSKRPRSKLAGSVVVTLLEGPAVYWWLRLEESGAYWAIPIGLLWLGQLLETTAVTYMLRDALAPPPPGDRNGIKQHLRRFELKFGAAMLAELVIWLLWLWLATDGGQELAAVVLLVLMHLKHQFEAVTVRDTPFSRGLLAWRVTVASAAESGGAIACLALIRDGHVVWAAAALAAGFLVEHYLLIEELYGEMGKRNIAMPNPRPPRVPFRLRPLAYFATRFGPVWRLLREIGWLQRLLNRQAVNALVNNVPPRPDPLSTYKPYTTWTSLADRTWSGRHLPPTVDGPRELPPAAAVAELFVRDKLRECPKSTMLFPSFAQWFTDGFLRTARAGRGRAARLRDTRRNESTHEVDLCQLYGLNSDATDALRLKKGGLLLSEKHRGEEWPPYLCEGGKICSRFSALPEPFLFESLPTEQQDKLFAMGTDTRNLGFLAFNVLFLRAHNEIARRLAKDHPRWDDDRLFETARMILTVVLMRIVVEEYINHTTGYWFRFSLDPASFNNAPWQRPNRMAVEFNLLYRWHPLVVPPIDAGDEKLTIAESLQNTDALIEAGLLRFLCDASGRRAGRIKLFNTDHFLVEHAEIPSIAQGRVAQLRSYNDYRELCNLPRAANFSEFSSETRVRDGLNDLYESVDDVEFYVGLFAEQAGPTNVLPPLMTAIVSFDAFSQVYTNPLVSPRIFREETFSKTGVEIMQDVGTIDALVRFAMKDVPDDAFISLTRKGYTGP